MLGKGTVLLDPWRALLKFLVEALWPFEKADQRSQNPAAELRAMHQRDHILGRHRLEALAFQLFALPLLLPRAPFRLLRRFFKGRRLLQLPHAFPEGRLPF